MKWMIIVSNIIKYLLKSIWEWLMERDYMGDSNLFRFFKFCFFLSIVVSIVLLFVKLISMGVQNRKNTSYEIRMNDGKIVTCENYFKGSGYVDLLRCDGGVSYLAQREVQILKKVVKEDKYGH